MSLGKGPGVRGSFEDGCHGAEMSLLGLDFAAYKVA